jgi:hypothetical protein
MQEVYKAMGRVASQKVILNITPGTLRSRIRQLGINIRQAVEIEAG